MTAGQSSAEGTFLKDLPEGRWSCYIAMAAPFQNP